eukprot:gene7415-7624_t
MDRLLHAVAKQVARHCVEQGRLVDGLRERYAELAHCLYLGGSSLSLLTTALAGAAASATTTAAKQNSQVDNFKQQISQQQAELATLSAEEQQKEVPLTAHAAAQTDAAESEVAVESPPPTAEQPCTTASSSAAAEEEEEEEEEYTEDRNKSLDLLRLGRKGHVRSRLWVVKVIGQVYADKAVADAAADRQGQQRSSLTDFIISWHWNRYGLRPLALEALSDLVASTLHHADAGCAPALWFARFCGVISAILPGGSRHSDDDDGGIQEEQTTCQQEEQHQRLGDSRTAMTGIAAIKTALIQQLQQQPRAGTAEAMEDIQYRTASPGHLANEKAIHFETAEVDYKIEQLLSSSAGLDFYLFCCCQLAYPNSVLALFPEAEESLPLVRSPLVMESLKAIFRYLQDPEGQAVFVVEQLGAAAVIDLAPVDNQSCNSSRPGTSNSSRISLPANARVQGLPVQAAHPDGDDHVADDDAAASGTSSAPLPRASQHIMLSEPVQHQIANLGFALPDTGDQCKAALAKTAVAAVVQQAGGGGMQSALQLARQKRREALLAGTTA